MEDKKLGFEDLLTMSNLCIELNKAIMRSVIYMAQQGIDECYHHDITVNLNTLKGYYDLLEAEKRD